MEDDNETMGNGDDEDYDKKEALTASVSDCAASWPRTAPMPVSKMGSVKRRRGAVSSSFWPGPCLVIWTFKLQYCFSMDGHEVHSKTQ